MQTYALIALSSNNLETERERVKVIDRKKKNYRIIITQESLLKK